MNRSIKKIDIISRISKRRIEWKVKGPQRPLNSGELWTFYQHGHQLVQQMNFIVKRVFHLSLMPIHRCSMQYLNPSQTEEKIIFSSLMSLALFALLGFFFYGKSFLIKTYFTVSLCEKLLSISVSLAIYSREAKFLPYLLALGHHSKFNV